MPKKLRLSVNNARPSSERPLSPTVYVTHYHWPRIIGAGLVLLGLLAALYFWASSDDDAADNGLASDGEIEISTPASSDAGEPPVFVEPIRKQADAPAEDVSEPVPEPVNASEALSEASRQQRIPVPRDTTRDRALGSDAPLAETLSDQVHVPQQADSSSSIMAPANEDTRYRLTVQDEPVRKSAAKPSPAHKPSVSQGPTPEGIMTVRSNKLGRAVITDGISNSEPDTLLNDPVRVANGRQTTIHLLAEAHDMEGETLRLLWFHAGNEILNLPVKVRSQKSVVTASMSIASGQTGDWQVEVRDESGEPLATGHFQVKLQ